MNQLSLFADLVPASTQFPLVLTETEDNPAGSPDHLVQPRVDRHSPIESLPSTSAALDSAVSNSTISDVETTSEPDTLMKLAALIREGRDQLEAQSLRRSRPVQSIGDLAQSVLRRHDLVAQRRIAMQKRLASQSEQKAAFSDTPSEVHVAS